MKKLILASTFLVITMLFITHLKAQTVPDFTIKEETRFLMQRTIEFSNASEKEELTIKVNMQNCMFDFEIKSAVNNGKLDVEVYDPAGKKQGSFSVGCQINTQSNDMDKTTINDFIYGKTKPKKMQPINKKNIDNSTQKNELDEFVSGTTSKSIKNPMLGDWVIKFTPTNANGYIIINTRQILSSK
ncbi:hypothetical protein D1614_07595 [Maribellus luteus]|uniref:YtkA-like domain-containing protein n=1 Tax=Maribellus luteus TaxID=2305463 RepID=A0A399T3E1_9BACT|nr:hypothetical protein [Maribellus luteus]RIJ49395.1 hypothetical protein D1614_07595 [Maribellus luteus]